MENNQKDLYEESFFIIKPCGMQYEREILEELKKHFNVRMVNHITLTKDFLEKIYRKEESIFKKMNICYLCDKEAILGIVGGEEARTKLMEVCGYDYKPEFCDKTSIRYKYSDIRKPIEIHGRPFYINAIHRSQPEDAEEDIQIYINEVMKNKYMEGDER